MRILAYEFITGGGAAGSPIPAHLAREGESMLSCLLAELSEAEGAHVLTTRDARLAPAPWAAETVLARPAEDPLAHFAQAMLSADAVWPIAPETDGVLADLSEQVLAYDKLLLGSSPEAVRLSTSKCRTSAVLHQAGVPAVPTYTSAAQIPDLPGGWVVKPDDGAGCVETFRLRDADGARARLEADTARRYVAQPWIDGDALSLSLLCRHGSAGVLACNRQHLLERNGRLILNSVAVDARPADAALRELAQGVASALPGLWGYVGVDLVYGHLGPVVIEINPRLTTSYCGLGARRGTNIAAGVLRLLHRPDAARRRDDAHRFTSVPTMKEYQHAA